jgi:RNA polymerase sigma-70 factor (ECF subfamily)
VIVSAHEGTAGAFGILVDRYYAEIAAYCYRLTGDRELAADLTQETFLDAWRGLHRVADDQSFAAWLYRIALNHARPVLRRRRVLQFLTLDIVGEFASGRPAGATSDHEDEIVARDAVQQALDRLSHRQRAVLLLHGLAGFTSQEIAWLTGASPATVTRQITRAREQFRTLYAELAGDVDVQSSDDWGSE